MQQGVFIVLEGPDGSGTSSQARLLAERLAADGHDVLQTAQPTTGPIGQFIRHQLTKEGNSVTASSLQLLYTADRAWHVETVIEPALREGKVVVCERYDISTVFYGQAGGLDDEWLRQANAPFIRPDLLVVTLPPFDVMLERINARATKDIMEEKVEMQRQLHGLYAAYAQEHPLTPLVDTSKSLEESAAEIHALASDAIMRKRA